MNDNDINNNQMIGLNTDSPIDKSSEVIKDLILEAKDQSISKEFSALELYGTVLDPLFKASDIANILKLKNIYVNIKRMDSDLDYIKSNNKIFITEPGFYKLIFASRTPFAKSFQNFVCQILKRLRIQGNVSQSDIDEIRTELDITNGKNKKLTYKLEVMQFKNRQLQVYSDIKPLCNQEVEELERLRKLNYTPYYIYKTKSCRPLEDKLSYTHSMVFDMDIDMGSDNDNDIQIEIFININKDLGSYEILNTIYLNPIDGFENLQRLLKPYIKNTLKKSKKLNLKKTSPIYILSDIANFYDLVEASRSLKSDDIIDDFLSDDDK